MRTIMENEKDLPRAACVLIRRPDGKILAVSRKDDHTAFGLVGGKVEEGETCSQAAARELLEETGIKAKNLEFIFARECPGKVTYWTATYSADMDNQKPHSTEEGVVSWVEPKVLIDGPFGEYNKKLFEALGIKY